MSVIPTFVLLGINLAAQEACTADQIYRIRFQKLHYCPFLASKRMGAIFEQASVGLSFLLDFPKSIYRVVFDTLRGFLEIHACCPSQNRAH